MPEEANIPFMPEEDPDWTKQKCIRTGSSLSLVNITANISYSALYPRQQPWFTSDNPL